MQCIVMLQIKNFTFVHLRNYLKIIYFLNEKCVCVVVLVFRSLSLRAMRVICQSLKYAMNLDQIMVLLPPFLCTHLNLVSFALSSMCLQSVYYQSFDTHPVNIRHII